MQLTIIKEDNFVSVDGEGLNFSFDLPSDIWAVQWNGTQGEVEFNNGSPNLSIDSLGEYQEVVDAFNTEKTRLETERAQAEADALAAMTYADHRATEYPSIGEQLDMQYWDSVNGTTVWVDTIKAVKDKFPKE